MQLNAQATLFSSYVEFHRMIYFYIFREEGRGGGRSFGSRSYGGGGRSGGFGRDRRDDRRDDRRGGGFKRPCKFWMDKGR